MNNRLVTTEEVNNFIKENNIDIDEVTIEDCAELILFKLIVEQQKKIAALTENIA